MNVKTIWSRACRGCALVVSLLAAPLWGANLVSVSDGASTTEYATIEAALAACSGGETLTPWADICAKGWAFDPADGTPVVTGPVDAVPASPIVVTVVGGVPQKKTALADLRGLSAASGTLVADSFACDPDWPKSAHLLLEDGVLSVVNSRGSVLVIR